MQKYQRVLAVVDLGSASETIVRRALHVARQHGAELLVTCLVDYTQFECDHVPFLSPAEFRRQTADHQAARLGLMLARVGAPSAEGMVLISPSIKQALAELSAKWHPQMVVVGSRGSYGLDRDGIAQIEPECDVLSVEIAAPALWVSSSMWLKNLGQQLSWQGRENNGNPA